MKTGRIKKAVMGTLASLYASALIASGGPGFIQPSMSMNELEGILQEEKAKLGIDTVNIKLSEGKSSLLELARIEPIVCDSFGNITGYKIIFETIRNKFALRHELYHEASGYLSIPHTLINTLKGEVAANLYGIIGVKL